MDEPSHGYVEDGAEADERQDREDGRQELERRPESGIHINWKWVLAAELGVAGAVVAMYYLYNRITRLEDALAAAKGKLSPCVANQLDAVMKRQSALMRKVQTNAKDIAAHAAKVSTFSEKVQANGAKVSTVAENVQANAAKISTVAEKIQANGAKVSTVAEKVQANAAKISTVAEKVQANGAKVSTVDEKLVKTQEFIVDMAQRLKWPWPFNNRIKGLEQEFGLPKK